MSDNVPNNRLTPFSINGTTAYFFIAKILVLVWQLGW